MRLLRYLTCLKEATVEDRVLTRSGRAESQREANAIARDLEEMKFDGDRYACDIDIEAAQAIPAYTDDIREIIVSGIPV